MNETEPFFDAVRNDMTVVLATACEGDVSMRMVSPVYHEGNVLIFTRSDSKKYRQLKANPNCCIAAGTLFASATATFMGATMDDENEGLRAAYCTKFPDAFDEGALFGGRNCEFILLVPTKLSGWAFPDDTPAEAEAAAIPTIPFEIELR